MTSTRDLKYAKLEAHSQYRNEWSTDLTSALGANCPYCCFALFCPYCTSYHLRSRAIRGDFSRYICCNGDWPCSGRCGERSCPKTCLVAEVVCCFAQSVASTRWMLQDEMHLQNTKCDNCIIGTMIAAQYLACCCAIAACISGSDELAELAHLTDLVADILWVSVCACMQTQHKVQLDERDRSPGIVVGSPYAAPVPQAMHAGTPQPPPYYAPQPPPYYAAQPPPQHGPMAYPPQPGYGAPPPGYPAPQAYPPPPSWQQKR